MRHGTDAVAGGSAHADAALLAGLDQPRRRPAGLVHLEEDEVGLHARHVDLQSLDVGNAFGEMAGIVVILGEPVPVMLQRVERGGGNDAGLAHGATQHLLLAPGLVDELLRSRQAGADRRTQALGVIEPERVDAGGVVARLGAGLHAGIGQTRAIHVQAEAGVAGDLGDALHGGERPDRAAAAVRSVLDRHETGARGVAAVGVADRFLDLLAGEHAIGTVDHADHDAGIGGGATRLGVDDVGRAVGDHLVAQPAVHADGDLVAHGAARQEHGVFLAQKFADLVAQAVDRGVFHLLLVADFGVGHGLPHSGRGLRLGVAVKVDETVLHGVFGSPEPP